MKLLFCPLCGDVVKLQTQPRSCTCGLHTGKYLEDSWHAEVTEGAFVIALGNNSLLLAFQAAQVPSPERERKIQAYVLGEDAERVRYVETVQ